MATAGKRTIFQDGCTLPAIEAPATAAVRPGALVAQSATGIAESAQAATQFGAQPLFADYNMLAAKTVDDSYAIGENVIARQLESGKIACVLVAAGQDITAKGTPLSSNGDGTLKIAVTPATVGTTSEQVLCYAEEIINTGAAVALVRVRGA